MYVRHLQLTDFRSWPNLELDLTPGVTVFSGPNGHGKTNVVEALGYLASLSSHRVNRDAALVREGQDVASVSATAVNNGRELTAHIAIKARGANRAHINRTALKSARDVLGIVRTTLFSPEDLALVRGEPEQRRLFLDQIMVARYPRLAGIRADYDKALKQRNALLRNNAAELRFHAESGIDPEGASAIATLDVWDGQLAYLGAQLMSARVQIVHDLSSHVLATYQRLAPESRPAHLAYTSTVDEELAQLGIELGRSHPGEPTAVLSPDIAEAVLLEAFSARRDQEIVRGTTLLGPHRDDVILRLGSQPAKGYASHGESWSYALSLRLAAFFMQRGDGTEPVVILDDVFAELDRSRRQRLVELVQEAEQVLITAAVDEDIPAELRHVATLHTVEARETPDGRISLVDSADDKPGGRGEVQ
ncbi:DNA replication/repair protein RecF [Corynebacterium heidelbergense]|uniref:DNA replication and repair protein RecF n=1 Tax=Corynebacterium heidelbergense TaxID=2055947 RepID=A0A364VD31_9CORY|nr:DNA replication/repair protein RecF [Corynebacterium heidelbergense]RAV34534.1 DNA replication/repair protein RecF [Corynebacterium heidelbergense]WCZ35588.1 DNA replication and repair protein RecF [Corynebacterium heidelbergense]